MNYTQSIGNITELKCLLKFMELGYECSIPYGNGAKYDFIADVNGKMLRIQCKSSSPVASRAKNHNDEIVEAFSFSTVCATTNTQKTTRHTYDDSQIDYFATCFNEQVYLIPVNECSTSKTLRFLPPSNNNNYNKAEDYEIEKIIQPAQDFLQSYEDYKNRCALQKKEQPKLFCSECGTQITKYSKSGLCSICQAKTTRKTEYPTREELKEMIRKIPFTTIGKNYGVSDNAVRKWCKAMNLPCLSSEIKKISDEDWSKI